MNRYVVIRALPEWLGSNTTTPDVANYLVVDLHANVLRIVADCGDKESTADKVALALNEHDGGPL